MRPRPHDIPRGHIGALLAALAVLLFLVASAMGQIPAADPLAKWALPSALEDIPAPEANPLSEAKVELGRRLYHLGEVNCATCHPVANAGYTGGRQSFGHGGSGDALFRVAHPSLALDAPDKVRAPGVLALAARATALSGGELGSGGPNAAYDFNERPFPMSVNAYVALHLGDGLPGIDVQGAVAQVAHRQKLMGSGLEALFKEAFPAAENPDDEVHIGMAIASYERTLIPLAPVNRAARGEEDSGFTREMRAGMYVYDQHCNSCHAAPWTTADIFIDLGCVDLDGGRSEGRALVTRNPADQGARSVPPIYNIKDANHAFHGAECNSWDFDAILERHAKVIDLEAINAAQRSWLEVFVYEGLYDDDLARLEEARPGAPE